MSVITVNDISYRQGFIEVIAGIHPLHVNLETWNIHPEFQISGKSIRADDIPDEAIIGNTELELSLEQARVLMQYLQVAIAKAEQMAPEERR
jgi:hypothetical protein